MSAVLRAIVVDDEPLARRALVDCLEERGDVTVLAECSDGVEALDAIARHAPDLMFLDIQMPEMSGFEVLERIESARVPIVIFATAHSDHALEAFDVAAVDYLLKPIDGERIDRAVERAKRMAKGERNMKERAVSGDDDPVAHQYPVGPSGTHATRVKVRDGDHIQFVRVDRVEWFEADGNYVLLHLEKDEGRIRSTLRGLEDALDPRQFVRVHRSAIINMDYLKEVQPWFSGDYLAIMKSGQQIRVSRRYKESLLRDIF